MMAELGNVCKLCGNDLGVLRHPIRRLRWTKYWSLGFKSLFGRPLKECLQCGAVYTWEEDLVAEGVVETAPELRLRNLRDDMANMRNSFGTIFLAGEFAALWMWFGPGIYEGAAPLVASAIAVLSLGPAAYFNRRVSQTRKRLKEIKEARAQGLLGGQGRHPPSAQ